MPPDGWMRRYVQALTPRSEAPAETHVAAALALMSAAVGWKGWIQWGRSKEPCTVWVCIEGASAQARKSTASNSARDIARDAAAIVGGESPVLVARRMSHTSNRGLIELVAPRDAEQAKAWEHPGLPPGVLLEWDEFGSVLGRPGDTKGADWLGQVRATLMALYGGRHGGLQTGAVKIPEARCALSLIATMTRKELEQRVSLGLLEDGFMGRLLLVPHAGRDSLISRPPRLSPEAEAEERRLVEWLADIAGSTTVLGDVFMRMTPAAERAWDEWYERRTLALEKQAAESGEPEDAAALSVFGRLQTTAIKAAMCGSVAAYDPWGEGSARVFGQCAIDAEHVAWGTALADWSLEEARSLAAAGEGFSRVVEFQRKVVSKVRSLNGHGPIPMRELLQRVRAKDLDYRQRKQAVWDLHPEVLQVEVLSRGTVREKTVVSMAAPEPQEKGADAVQTVEGSNA